jgi:UDP-N-acetylmuramyl pentapeptide phosphotransferase/UDP-N-acetylglucosamine-1-phosphate transferase
LRFVGSTEVSRIAGPSLRRIRHLRRHRVRHGIPLLDPSRTNALHDAWLLLLCSLPAFLSGLVEDLTKRVSARRRLLFTTVSAALGCWLLGAILPRTAIPGIDLLMPWTPFAVALTLLCVTGVANSVNIIDGFNGLASMCVLLILLALTYGALQVGDTLVLALALICAGAVLGFLHAQLPAGLIFLGDGGAYLLGFMIAELSVL